ncbi:MAG: ATP-dependent DNA helicase, partial [Deltaproteobacteria bacterium]|nr:ATP-dependent DNA helicase [Deltaproteobacteria bacterium]
LKEEGFVDEGDKLTYDGLWASQLRLDQPLMVAEALRLNILPESNPVLLAALVAPFVHDRDAEVSVNESNLTRALLKAYENMKRNLIPLMKRKEAWGFEVKPITLWASASIYAWASGQSWENVLEMAGISEGDLAMLVLRTAENLRQIGSLRKTYPAISQIAFEAIDIILREPVATKY